MTRSAYGLALGISLAAPLALGCGTSSGSPIVETPTFTEVYTKVMVPHGCNAHHRPGKDNDAFLDMSTQAAAYENLVKVTASGPAATASPVPGCGGSGLVRVVPGDAAKSLMYQKVSEAKPPCGAQMPFGCPGTFACLDSTEQQTLAAWINGGAPND